MINKQMKAGKLGLKTTTFNMFGTLMSHRFTYLFSRMNRSTYCYSNPLASIWPAFQSRLAASRSSMVSSLRPALIMFSDSGNPGAIFT